MLKTKKTTNKVLGFFFYFTLVVLFNSRLQIFWIFEIKYFIQQNVL